MATEKRLIDPNEFLNRLENTVYDTPTDFGYTPDLIKTVLEQTKTVDAVEVVRCKECRFCKKHPTSDKVKLCTNEHWNTEYHPFAYDNGYCSYGERRTNA